MAKKTDTDALTVEQRLTVVERALELNGHNLVIHARALGYVEETAEDWAAAYGVNLAEVRGTGDDGEITQADIRRHARDFRASYPGTGAAMAAAGGGKKSSGKGA